MYRGVLAATFSSQVVSFFKERFHDENLQCLMSPAEGASIFKRAVAPIMEDDIAAEELKVSHIQISKKDLNLIFVSLSQKSRWRFLDIQLDHILSFQTLYSP